MTAAADRSILSDGPERTRALAERLAKRLPPGTVLSLCGELGAGKTVFVQGLARGLGCARGACSPTFVLLHVYGGGRLPLYHFDAYRLRGAADLSAAGADELLPGDGVTAIEWGERVAEALPRETLCVTLTHEGPPTHRRLAWASGDPASARLVDECWLSSCENPVPE